MIKQVKGESIIVKNVTKEELHQYDSWIDQTSWSGNMGYTLFPSITKGAVSLLIESGFSGTWRNDIRPALEEYWGENRIIHEVEFE